MAGSAEQQGDLKSIVLHKMCISAQKNDFPLAVGARITGVDDSTFSVTGDAYSTISLPGANSHSMRVLQEDDVSLAYEFVMITLEPDPSTTSPTDNYPCLSCSGPQVPRARTLSNRSPFTHPL